MLRPRSLVFACAGVAALATSLHAQQDESAAPRPAGADRTATTAQPTRSDGSARDLLTDRTALTAGLRVPIHTAADDPEGGAYGIWAGGSDYKASFHDGFTFVPYLGRNYPRNQQLHWRTTSVQVGERTLPLTERPATWHSDYRFEYRFGTVTEAYDLGVDGVEQTFVFDSLPFAGGDLVVRGALTTDLSADLLIDQHGALTLRDERGNELIHYGAATVLDAAGRSLPISTTFDGSHVHLRVPADWLADASFPVTIDPLINRNCVAFWTSVNPPPTAGTVEEVDIGRDDLANQLMVAYTRSVSATDSDMWIFLFDDDTGTFATRNQVFVDMTTSWGNSSPAIAFAGGTADRWIVAFTRLGVGGSGTQNGVRYHRRASGDVVANTSFTSVSRPGGSSHGSVDVGGVMSGSAGSTVFLVYERTDSGSNTDVFGKPIDLATNAQGTETLLDTSVVGTDRTRLRPSINQVAQSGTDGWVVAWQEYWNARNTGGNDDWDINMRRINGTGATVGLVRAPTNSTNDTIHKLTPIVSGANSRYSMTMSTWAQGTQTPTTTDIGTDIFNETFTWTTSDSFAFGEIAELTLGLVSDRRWRVTDGTHDTNTDSHWAWTFESTLSGSQYYCSTGFDAGRIERLVAYNPTSTPQAFSGSITFDDDAGEFVLSYGTDEGGAPCGTSRSTNHTIYTQRATHLPEPAETVYGVGCGRGVISPAGRNLAGIRSYSINLTNATPSVPAVLYLNLSQGNLPLGSFGMNGCVLNLNPFGLISIPAATSSSGRASFRTSLPTNPTLVCGDLFWQWAYIAPGINPLGVAWTQGLQTSFICP